MKRRARKPAIPGRGRGRPPIYTPELGERICKEIASGKSLRTVCEQPGMPHMDTVFSWMRAGGPHVEFSDQYARACIDRGHALAESALAIADAPVRRIKGHMDAAEVNDKRLKVDTRKWFASKLAPRAFGDRVQAELTGADGGPVAFTLTPMDWDGLIRKVTRGEQPEPPADVPAP
jgi:hypothetical protein